jgi:hypothetical protein
MKSKPVLTAFGLLAEDLAQARKERDDLTKFRDVMSQRLQELIPLIKDEPESVANADLIDVVKAVLARQKKELNTVREARQTNGALPLADLDGVLSH